MHFTRRQFLYGTAAATAALAFAPRSFAQQGLADSLNSALRAPVERGDIVGAIGAITNAEDTIYSGAFGERELGGGVAMTEDTVCNMASMTKAITGACAMQLVEQGKLDLDSPITNGFPQAAELKVLDGWDGDKPVLRAPASDDHPAPPDDPHARHGLRTRGTPTRALGRADNQPDGLPAARLCRSGDLGGAAADVRPRRSAGTTASSIDWVGRLIVETSGKPLGAYMQENIFEPLGMTSTGYAVTPDMAGAAGDHPPAGRGRDASRLAGPAAGDEGPVREYGGGGLNGTAPDYQRFIRMILNGGSGNGNQLLKPETVADMAKNHMGDIRVQMLPDHEPERARSTPSSSPGCRRAGA